VFTKRVLTMAMAGLAVSASAALAGTKYQANIVPASATNPPSDPTMSAKGKVKLDDKGNVKVGIKGVTDAGGVPAESSFAGPALDGTEYIYIVKGTFVSLGVQFEVDIPIDVKKGNGKAALSLSSQFALIPMGAGRGVEITGGEVWGPLGAANVAACQPDVTAGVSLVPGNTNCRGGTQIGVAGVFIP
jgi:hypothetical protein